MRIGASILSALVALTVTGCGTIMQGSKQDVAVSSTPTGAQISVDGQVAGVTPATLRLARKNGHLVRIELPGYQPFEMNLTRKVSSIVWGNIVFGGIPGLVVDAVTGGMYQLTPEQIAAELRSTSASARMQEGTMYVAVTLAPKAEWQRIGTLTPAGR